MNIPFELTRRKDFREASDTGLLLWRKNFFYIMQFFAVPFWICAFVLRLIPGLELYWSWLIIWLLKPLFDRPVLHIISVRFFEKDANHKRLRQGMWRSILRGLPGDLLWRRFSPLRCAMMPMRVLEQNSKSLRELSQRKKLLKKGGINFCFLLTLWGITVEITMLFGVMLFIILMLELIMGGPFSSFWDSFQTAEIYFYAVYCFNFILVEPVYVCMGFSLYINSRIEVEGWDLEIIFRNFAKKLKEKTSGGVLAALLLLLLLTPLKTFADNGASLTDAENVPLSELKAIFDSPQLGGEQDAWGIRFKKPLKELDFPSINLEPMKRLRDVFAFVLRLILTAAIAALVVCLFLYIRKFNFRRGERDNRPNIKSLQKTYEENPKQLLEKALIFHEQGNTRLAWAHCTAAAILSWPFYRGLAFPPNATESDCAGMVNSMTAAGKNLCNAKEAHVFSELIKTWVYFAYAGLLPPNGSFEQAIAFCRSLEAANE